MVSCLMPSPAFKVVRVNHYGESRDFPFDWFSFRVLAFSPFGSVLPPQRGVLGGTCLRLLFHVNFVWSLIAVRS